MSTATTTTTVEPVSATRPDEEDGGGPAAGDVARERLLTGIPVTERRLELAGVSTAVLEGGAGPPVVLLHGPGEFAAKWMRVIPGLVRHPSRDRPRPAGARHVRGD